MQNTAFSTKKTLNINGRLIDFREPKIMGVLNLTPDSFSDGGHYVAMKDILQRVEQMCSEGATFIDIGGYSSRPGATNITQEQELERVIPAIKNIHHQFPHVIISIDTFRSSVAKIAVHEGASIINDISGGLLDDVMFETLAELNVPYILMHMKGNPQTMAKHADYKNLMKELVDYFHQRIYKLHQLGIKDIVIDPGFGFSKTREHNFELLNNLELLKILNQPMLVGLSRKSMIWKTLNIEPVDALNGTTVL